MKYVFILVLLIVGGVAAAMGGVVALRWVDDMTQTPKIVTGERVFPMPTGVLARGGPVILPREQRELAAKIPNPVKASAESVTIGKERYLLGNDIDKAQVPQLVVPAGEWQMARSQGDYSLVGCTVAPGFQFAGFELAAPGFEPV